MISAGFKHIDAASFVSPKAVPQMADSEEVLKELDPPDDVEIIGIVVNEKGAQRAIATGAVRTLGFPYSVSPSFLQNNQNQTLEDAIDELEKINNKGEEAGLDLVVYVRWRSAILMAIPGTWEKWWMRSNCSKRKEFAQFLWPTRWDWPARRRFANSSTR